MIAFLVFETLMIGVFASLDLVMFYVFFEGSPDPDVPDHRFWGGPRTHLRDLKFFLYTLRRHRLHADRHHCDVMEVGSTRYPPAPRPSSSRRRCRPELWIGFFASFAVKVPMWPFHTLVARSARRGSYGWLGDPCGIPPEVRRLWLPPVLAPDVPGCVARSSRPSCSVCR